jgi:hypothetical protein
MCSVACAGMYSCASETCCTATTCNITGGAADLCP